jgi:hypothetical protein
MATLATADIAKFESRSAELLISRNFARERVRDALRLYVGRGRRFSVKQLSNATGIPDRMIESALCSVDDPDFRPLTLENLFSAASVLGAPFVSDLLEPCGLGAFELSGQAPLPKVLATADPNERPADKVKRLSRELADALEEL